MAQLNIRIDDDSRDLLDALARARELSISDLVRQLVRQAIGRDEPRSHEGSNITPSTLSAVERRRLVLQHEILAHLTDDTGEGHHHRQMIEVLNNGLTNEYYRMFQMIEPELTLREGSLLVDILQMFTMLELSLSTLTSDELASLGDDAERRLTFRGFDGNDRQESRLSTYAEFLIRDGRWGGLADRFDDKHDRGNSHMPMLAIYQRMLTVWKPLWNRKMSRMGGANDRLSVDDLREILTARLRPTDR